MDNTARTTDRSPTYSQFEYAVPSRNTAALADDDCPASAFGVTDFCENDTQEYGLQQNRQDTLNAN
jgi:hypothetical protein